MTRTREALFAAACLCATAALSACNTMEGLGRDTSSAGHSLGNAANQGRADMHAGNAPECADMFHQDRPGGTDYKGPPDPRCPQH